MDYQDVEARVMEAQAYHGHLCGGIALGVRMALLGLRSIGIRDPKGEDRKKLMVYVEIDRCATDAIASVTGCRPGRRTMKIFDYGKMAAGFLNLETGAAVRVAALDRPRDPAENRSPEESARFLLTLPDETLFHLQHVRIPLAPGDLPGLPVRSVVCARCGEGILDHRDVEVDGEILCRPCAQGRSYCLPGAVEVAR